MGHLVLGYLLGVLRYQRILESHRPPADDAALRARARLHIGGQPCAKYRVVVELRFQIFQVQRKVQDLDIRRAVVLGIGITAATPASRQNRAARHTCCHASGLAEKLTPVLQFLGPLLQYTYQH